MTTIFRADGTRSGEATRRIHVHIDRLLLRGIDPADQRAFTASLKAEFVRVLGEAAIRDGMAKSGRTPVMRLDRMSLEPGQAGARTLGAGVAKAIGKGIAR
jgi:hypothetical protein